MLDQLTRAGFVRSGCFRLGVYEGTAPAEPGVYAFVVGAAVMYVGSAQRSLGRRIGSYSRVRHKPPRRVHVGLATTIVVDVFTVVPADGDFAGLPVNTIAGLEIGLIRAIRPVWNRR